jgi:hypothetical protein
MDSDAQNDPAIILIYAMAAISGAMVGLFAGWLIWA